jgi:predicted dehydrogenase
VVRLGVIGLSEGNGHPYSWSAIVNGYDPEAMASCPFPAIPRYLAERRFPEDALSGACVSHVWTQDARLSREIARAALIEHVASAPEDLVGAVDAVLLARDDAERHRELAAPFLAASMPVYVDKPLATSVAEARAIYALERRPGQIFTCTPLRYSAELAWTDELAAAVGEVEEVDARTPKGWATYGVHVVEPVLVWLGGRRIEALERERADGRVTVAARFAGGVRARFSALGVSDEPISIQVRGSRGAKRLVFADSFSAFRSALAAFLEQVRTGVDAIPRDEVLDVVRVVEAGM